MKYITIKRDSLEAQGVPVRASKVYKCTIKPVTRKQQQNKLADAQTNKRARPPQMRIYTNINISCLRPP